MTRLIIKLKNLLYHNTLYSKLGFIFVVYLFCLGAIKLYGHEAAHVQHERSKVASRAEKTEKNVLTAITEVIGDSSTDHVIAKWLSIIKQGTKNDTAWVHLGNALMQKVRETGDETQYRQAEYAYRQALAVRPKNVAATIGIAWVNGGLHRFGQSIEWAEKALDLDPQNPDAHGLIADAKVEFGDYEAAKEHIQKMLDNRPDLSSYSRAAHLLFLTGDVQKATWLMRMAIDAGGPYAENTAWCRAQLAMMLWNTGALSLAEQELDRALKTAPNNYYVLDAIGKIKSAQKDYDTAIDYYTKAIIVTPNPKTLIALGDLYIIKGEREKADEQFRRVVKQHSHEGAHVHHGNILLARFYADHDRKLPEALKEAETVYMNYKNVFVTDTLAWCYYKNGRYEEARQAIQKALRWQTPDANIFFHAGMIYAKLSEYAVAQKYLYQALSLNPNFHPVYSTVAADTLKRLSGKRLKS